MRLDKDQQAFFALVTAGLWEQEARLLPFGNIDFEEVYRLAEEQAVVGLVAAGLEHVEDRKVPKTETLTFVGRALQLEQRNLAMNNYLSKLMNDLYEEGIKAVLVKGQGIAQCYVRPFWRSSGDIDLLLDDSDYLKAKNYLRPLSTSNDEEDVDRKHWGLTIGPWLVELHGTLREPLLKRINPILDRIQKDTFQNNHFRFWKNESIEIMLPDPDNDVIFVFTHILQHYFGTGVGLRQICDWIRLLWTYRENINTEILKERLQAMDLMPEWQVFSAYAVEFLGAPSQAMLLYDGGKEWVKKAKKMNSLILQVGNFGQGRDLSYYHTRPYLIRKAISFKFRVSDAFINLSIFPKDSIATFYHTFFDGIRAVLRGKY